MKDNLARDAAIAVAGAVAQRLRVKYKDWKKPRVVKVLYGPTGDVVARVSVHEEEAGD